MTMTTIVALTLMNDMLILLLGCAVVACTALSLYLLFLAVASLRRLPQEAGQDNPATRFAVLIPAHEEELVIGQLLESIYTLDYPRDLFGVYVIADHCSDSTAAIARSFGATVYERSDPDPLGKSHSLNWAVRHLLATESGESIEAFVVLDADSIISRNFLRSMDSHLRLGNLLVQGLVQIDDPRADRIGQLRALAYEFISYLRPLGRSALGISVGLRGNGMCIAREFAERFPWDPGSLAEDYELHGRLLAARLRVTFAPDAIVHTQLPRSLAVARKQSERWERGRLDSMRHHVPALLSDGLRRRSWSSIDGAIELLIPPFSLLIALMVGLFGLSLLSGVGTLIASSTIGLVALCLYTLRGLALASRHYPQIYRALLFVPAFVVWRLYLYVGVVLRRGRVQWTRTLRTPNR